MPGQFNQAGAAAMDRSTARVRIVSRSVSTDLAPETPQPLPEKLGLDDTRKSPGQTAGGCSGRAEGSGKVEAAHISMLKA